MIKNIKLPKSLRLYIRRKKAEIRKRFGKKSSQEQDFLKWIEKKKREKQERLENLN